MFSHTQDPFDRRDSRVQLLLSRIWAHAQDPVFTVKPHADARLQVLRDKGRHSNTKVNVESVLDLLCGAFRNTMALSDGSSLLWRYRLVFVLAWLLSEGDDLDALFNGGGDDAVDVDSGQVDGVW